MRRSRAPAAGSARPRESLAEASDEQVLAQAQGLAREMLAHGTTTFECKSGYGLSPEGEVRSVGLAAALRDRVHAADPVDRAARPRRARGLRPSSWMDEVAKMLPDVLAAGDVSALDIYVESVAFSNDDLRRMGSLAAANGLDLRAHVEQFNWNASVPVAIELGARSVDHLACLPDERGASARPVRDRRGAAARRRVPRRRAPGSRARARRRGGDLRARHRPEPRHLARSCRCRW